MTFFRSILYLSYRGRAVGRASHGLERGGDDIGVHPNPPQDLAGRRFSFDVADRLDLLAGFVGDLLDHLGELDLEKTRHVDAVVALQDVGDAALARLAVDPDDRLVAAAEIGRVDRQVGHFPDLAVRRLQRPEALVD